MAVGADATTRLFSTSSWDVLANPDGGYAIGLIGYTPDGSRLLTAESFMAGTSASLAWFDVASTELVVAKEDMPESSLRSVALSPDGTLVATATADGFVRVWEGSNLDLLHEIPLGDTPIEGVGFITNEHLAVTPADGDLLVVTTNPDELLDITSSSLHRGFTGLECGRFDFGDRCPTIAELGGRPAGVDDPALLNGIYESTFSSDDLQVVLRATPPLRLDAPRGERDVYLGTYRVTFADGRFDVVHDGTQPYCTGSYAIVGDHIRMLAERAAETFVPPQCGPGRPMLDATFELQKDGLRLSNASGDDAVVMLFTGKTMPPVS